MTIIAPIAHTEALPEGRILELEEDVARAREQIEALITQRSMALHKAASDLRDLGHDARVVETYRKQTSTEGIVCETFETFANGRTFHRVEFWEPPFGNDQRRDAFLVDGRLVIWHGTFELIFRDERLGLVVRVPGADDEERARRLAIGRLRTAARREQLRVRVRDREVSLIDPMNTIIHTGDVISAFACVAGIDMTTETAA